MPTIEFTTYSERTLRDFKPVLAKSYQPDWWKNMKVFQAHHGYKVQSIRSCPSMDDWLKMGWYILANRDLDVICGMSEGDQEDQIEWRGFDGSGAGQHSSSHPSSQGLESFEYTNSEGEQVNDAFKFRQPWGISTPKGYSCFFLDPFLFQNKHFAVYQGIIDTDGFNVGYDNSQVIFYPKCDHSFTIPEGTPLVQVIPFRREEWIGAYLHNPNEDFIKNRSGYTSNREGDNLSMEEWQMKLGQAGPIADATNTEPNFGGYRKGEIWKMKGKFFNEESPPPECPAHKEDDDTT